MLLIDYIDTIGGLFHPQIMNNFYQAVNLYNFIKTHRSVNKSLLITHMSQIINHSYNTTEDLRDRQINIALKLRTDFRSLICKKTSIKSSVTLRPEDVLQLIKTHRHRFHPYCCYAMVQLALALRYDNVSELSDPIKFKLEPKRCICDASTVCNPVLISCLSVIKFARAKKGAFEVPIIQHFISFTMFTVYLFCTSWKFTARIV